MVQKLKIVVGITGGFGTGKTTIAKMFESFGAERIDADLIAREALAPESPLFEKVSKEFPEAMDAGTLNRRRLAEIIFKDSARRKKIEAIIHPYVLETIKKKIAASAKKVVVMDVPLLYEAGFETFCTHTITVSAPEDVARERVQEKGFNSNDFEQRNKAQWSLKEKEKRSTYLIDNSKNLELTRRKVDQIWKDLHPDSKGEH